MERNGGYNTRTRRRVLEYLRENRSRAVSAADIWQQLAAGGDGPNPATVYRCLDKLCGEGQVMKYVADKGEKAVYQYVGDGHCGEHLHLQCLGCGKIEHLDCAFMEEMKAHLRDHHGFALQCRGGILYGLCAACLKRQAAQAPDTAAAGREEPVR